MEFRDLKEQYRQNKELIDKAILSVVDNADFIHGAQVTELEEQLSEYVGVKHCVTCANGTDALQLALMAWGVGSGDAVFVPDFTFFSSGEVVPLVGATPIFVDIDEATYNISPESLENAILYVLNNTDLVPRVIVAVDLFGQPADYNKIKAIAEKYQLLILEDAAQGFGGKIGEKRACSFGDIAITSFFPAKPLGCYGDGGAVFTNSNEWADTLRSLAVHGKGLDKYDNVRIGMNSRLDTIQAAILLEKIKFFDEEIDKCNNIAERYSELLKGYVELPVILEGFRSSWAQYTIQLKDQNQRKAVMEKLKSKKIPCAIYYKNPMHAQKAFSDYKTENLAYKNTEMICERCLSLPMHPYLTENDIEVVAEILKDALR